MNSVRSEAELLAAMQALETASEPLPPDDWPVLADPGCRQEINRRLRMVGRTLVVLRKGGDPDLPVTGYLSGWDEETANALLHAGHDPLTQVERAVLALVLVHSVAIPQTSGVAPARGLRSGVPVESDRLWDRPGDTGRGLGQRVVEDALKVLAARGLITPKRLPGPVFDRLTPSAADRVWRNLLVLARPTLARHLPHPPPPVTCEETS